MTDPETLLNWFAASVIGLLGVAGLIGLAHLLEAFA